MSNDKKKRIQQLLQSRGAPASTTPLLQRKPASSGPASYGQRGLWLAQQAGATSAYHIVVGLHVRGAFDVAVLAAALGDVVQRHEVLRTRLRVHDGELIQEVMSEADLVPDQIDMSGLPEEKQRQALTDFLAAQAMSDFDMATAPLARVAVLCLAADQHVVVSVLHHAISDGWSQGVLAAELGQAYSHRTGGLSVLPELAIQYLDFSRWQHELVESIHGTRQISYWREKLKDVPPIHGLICDGVRRPGERRTGARHQTQLDPATVTRLQEIAASAKASLFHALLGLYAASVARFGDLDDVVIGFASANRRHADLQKLIGYFVTSLPARLDLGGQPSLTSLLARVREVVVEAMANGDVPLDILVDRLGIGRDASMHPLFQLFFSLQEGEQQLLSFGEAELTPLDAELLPQRAPKFDLSLVARHDAAGVSLIWEYNARLFDQATIQSFSDTFLALTHQAVASPDLPLALMKLADGGVIQGPALEDRPVLLLERFESHLRQRPSAFAIVDDATSLTYTDLDRCSDALARRLIGEGAGSGVAIASIQPRGVGSIATMLAAFKIGATFVPLDPATPAHRMAGVLRGCAADIVVVEAGIPCELDGQWRRVQVTRSGNCDEGSDEKQPLTPRSAQQDNTANAYIIHTSGSSGVPKGVVIGQANLAHFVAAMIQRFGFAPGWTFAITTNPATDIGIGNIFVALACGGTLHILDDGIARDPARYAEYMQEHPIDVVKFTPNHYLALFQPGTFGTPSPRRLLILAGEPLLADALAQLQAHSMHSSIVNSYGPSECSVSCCAKELSGPVHSARVPIGEPLPGVELRVMNRAGCGQPLGAVGELWVAGPTVGQGYRDPGGVGGFARDRDGVPVYRTGDIVRRRPDGGIEFLERRDAQVKIRGYRVELAEVENVLRSFDGIANAAVRCIAQPEGDLLLCAYLIALGPKETAAVEAALIQRLPEYMRPRHIRWIDAIPLRSNGKVDVDALPLPLPLLAGDIESGDEVPRTPTEIALAMAWTEVLGGVGVGRRSDFFALGGNSIRSIRVAAAAARHGVKLDVGQLLQTPRLDELARLIDAGHGHGFSPSPKTLPQPFELAMFDATDERAEGLDDAYPLTALQEAMIARSRAPATVGRYVIVRSRRLHGPLDVEMLKLTVGHLMAAHPVLRTSIRMEAGIARYQQVHTDVAPPVFWHDGVDLESDRRRELCGRIIAQRRAESLVLDLAPLFRLDAVRIAPNETELIWTAHHAILDGWSVATLFARAADVYECLVRGERVASAVQDGGLAQLVASERAAATNSITRAYWTDFVQHHVDCTLPTLPDQAARGIEDDDRVPMVHLAIPASIIADLVDVARSRHASIKAVMFAAYAMVLSKLSGKSLVCTGYCTHRREATADALNWLGLYVTTLPVLINTSVESWGDLIDAAHKLEQTMWPHRHMPLVEIQRLAGGKPVFEHFFNFNDFTDVLSAAPEESLLADGDVHHLNEFALTLNVVLDRSGNDASIYINYDPSRQSHEQVELFGELVLNALHGILDPAASPELLTGATRKRVIEDWNSTERAWNTGYCLHEPVLDQALANPDAVALIDAAGEMSFGQMGNRVSALARRLLDVGLAPGQPVGILLPRGRDQVIAAIAVLAAGGVYVPLDFDWPPARRNAVLQEAGVGLLLAMSMQGEIPSKCEWLDPSCVPMSNTADLVVALRLKPRSRQPDDPAYIIYTSGSTGRPKGVVMSHRAVINTLLAINELVGLTPADRVLSVSALTFDLSVYDLFGVLGMGACAVLLEAKTSADPANWMRLARDHGVTVWNSVPLAAQMLLEAAEAAGLNAPIRHFLLSGDRIPTSLPARLKKWFGGSAVTSLGGATEAAIWSIEHRIGCDTTGWRSIPYGRPLANQRFFILDTDDRLIAPGALGQLHIAGDGLALGYHKDAERSALQFFTHPELGQRLYRTGDIGRYLPDGTIELAGRVDHQVKVRGYRIELGDIEACLGKADGVRDVVVLLRTILDSQEAQLVAYLVAQEQSPAGLRRHVARELPAYMVPQAFVILERMPLGANGKLDRALLPNPREADFAQGSYMPPSTELERRIADVWQRVLGRSKIGVEDNFFELGGDSILALRLVSECGRAGLSIALRDFYAGPTVAEMTACVGVPSTLHKDAATGDQLLLPIHRRFFERGLANPNQYNQALMLEVPPHLNVAAWRAAVRMIVRTHDALRLRFSRGEDGWAARYADAGANTDAVVQVCDLASLASHDRQAHFAATIEKMQRSLDLPAGITLRTLYADFGDAPGRLLLIAHHLVVDAVSWQILLRDLADAYVAADRGQAMALSAPNGSLKNWAGYLHSEEVRHRFGAQIDYWVEQLAGRDGLSANAGTRDAAQPRSTTLTLTESAWEQLDETALRNVGLSRHELLLAAVYVGLRLWSGAKRQRLLVESHGRSLSGAPEAADAVGWFTAMFPLLLESDADDLLDVGHAIADRWRDVPDAGIGYGVLRHIEAHPDLLAVFEPVIHFNYFGEFGGEATEPGLLRLSDETSGDKIDPESPRDSLITISAAGTPRGLSLSLDYAARELAAGPMESLLESVAAALRDFLHRLGVATDVDSQRREQRWAATSTQRGMLLHSLLEPDRAVYVNQLGLRLAGNIDEELLRQAWQAVIHRHDVLRSGFAGLDQEMPQCIAPAVTALPWRTQYLDIADSATSEIQLSNLRAGERAVGFDFSSPPLMRFLLVRLGTEEVELVWTYHHVLLDGWSLPLVLSDVQSAYVALKYGLPVASPPPQFEKYAKWLQLRTDGPARNYWRELLRGFAEPTRVPLPPPLESGAGVHVVSLDLDDRQTSQITAAARTSRCTVNIFVQAAWAYVLHRYTGADDVVFGATHSGRPSSLRDSERMVGLFINSLPVRARIDDAKRVEELLEALFRQQADSVENGHLALSEIHASGELPSGVPLFDSVVVFENYQVESGLGSTQVDLRVSQVHSEEGTHYPLTLLVIPGRRRLRLRVRARADLFAAADIERLAGHWREVINAFASDPGKPLGEVDMFPPSERQQLIRRLAFEPRELRHARLDNAFAETVERFPNRVAARFGQTALSYAELDRRAEMLAQRLLARGAAGTRVAICLDRSLELPVALLGVLKAGATYVPLDPATPLTRRRYIFADADCRYVVTDSMHAVGLGDSMAMITVDADDEDIAVDASVQRLPNDEAYVIYTSGTTGQPKGVIIEHRSVLRLFDATASVFGFDHNDVIPLFHSFAFDVSVWEMWSAWLHGGTLVIVPALTTRDATACLDLLTVERATILNQTPTAFEALMRAETERRQPTPFSLRHVIFAGEALDFETLAPWVRRHGLDRPTLWNLYGITETTVHTTVYRVTEEDIRPLCRRIGVPISDLQVRIVDARGRDVPIGIAGEIWVAGAGVAVGYHNRPELTEQRFIEADWNSRCLRYYRSGDLGRYRDDGGLDYLGRNDRQVKLRGFRIELGEIESQLLSLPSVEKAVVIVRGEGTGRHLVGYVLVRGATASSEYSAHIRHRLAGLLPDHMVPAAIVPVEDFPRNHNGKLDLAALPPVVWETAAVPGVAGKRSADSLERDVLAIWSEVLGFEIDDIDADFFDLGGHSLKLGQVVSRLRGRHGGDVSFAELYKNPSVAKQAALLRRTAPHSATAAIPRLSQATRRAGVVLSPDQLRLWYLCQDSKQNLAYGTHFVLDLHGPLDGEAALASLRELVVRHESLRTLFRQERGQVLQFVIDPQPDQVRYRDSTDSRSGSYEVDNDEPFTFDLARTAPFLVRLVKLDENVHRLAISIHHIVSDAWSIGLLIGEFSALYKHHTQAGIETLAPSEVQLADVCAWMAQRGHGRAENLAYWSRALAGHRGLLPLRRDQSSPEAANLQVGVVDVHWPAELAAAVRETARARGVTVFMLLMACYSSLLQRWSGSSDIIVGAAMAQRLHPDMERVIGFFANTLPIRLEFVSEQSGTMLLEQVRDQVLAAIEHGEVPLVNIVESLQIERQPDRMPLFQTAFTLQSVDAQRLDLPGIEVIKRDAERHVAKFDLLLALRESAEGISGEIEFDQRRYTRATVEWQARALRSIVEQMSADPDIPLDRFELPPIASTSAQWAGRGIDANDLDFLSMDELDALLRNSTSSKIS